MFYLKDEGEGANKIRVFVDSLVHISACRKSQITAKKCTVLGLFILISEIQI